MSPPDNLLRKTARLRENTRRINDRSRVIPAQTLTAAETGDGHLLRPAAFPHVCFRRVDSGGLHRVYAAGGRKIQAIPDWGRVAMRRITWADAPDSIRRLQDTQREERNRR